ncbi:S8 family serine peptidase [Roseivirga sp.]|uniref:S8 family serine peptidase n=1 Tax=Roseivirga sp. TaxID=1964215 RepID=UPI003B8B07CA
MKQVTSLFILFLTLSLSLHGQEQYMVFFKDKANTTYSTNRPLEFLSERSVSRRLKHNVAVSEEDIPVNKTYVTRVAALGVETFFTTRWMNAVLVQMEDAFVNDVLALSFVDRVELVSPNAILSQRPSERADTEESPIEPPRVERLQYQMLGINDMHAAGYKGAGVMVAIFDSGFENYTSIPAFNHILEQNRLAHTFNYVDNNANVDNRYDHGLRVLSILGADGEMIGAVPEATFVLAVTENEASEYRIEEYNWLFAAEMADSIGVDVINTSLGYSEFDDASMDYLESQMDGSTTVITRASNLAASKGILLVNSAGNQRTSSWQSVTAPADSENVLAVGAINSTESLASFSSSGPTADNRIKPDVVALGVNTQLLTSSNSIAFQSGTSFSSPLIAGLSAGLVQAFPEKTNLELMDIIRQSADRAEAPDQDFGYGIPFFETAAKIADAALIPIEEGVIAYPNPTDLTYLTLSFSEAFFGEDISVNVVNSNGSTVERFSFTPNLFNNKQQIDLSKVRPGLLLVRLVTPDGLITKKIIKTR